jgi:hypothetical protein
MPADDRASTTEAPADPLASPDDVAAGDAAQVDGESGADASDADAPGVAAARHEVPPAGVCCGNCDTPLVGPYCATCGQRAESRIAPLRELGHELIDNVLGLDVRLVRTLPPLLWRPGYVTADYLAGRRRRYVKPVRLLLLTGFVLVLILGALTRATAPDMDMAETAGAEAVAEMQAQVDSLAQVETLRGRAEWALARGGLRAMHNPKGFLGSLVQRLTLLAVVLLPVFALILKLLYVRRGRLYVEHLVFGAHVHAAFFVFIIALAATGAAAGYAFAERDINVGSIASTTFLAAAGIYLALAMRRVYGQGVMKTLVKAALLGVCYFITFLFAFGIYSLIVLALL